MEEPVLKNLVQWFFALGLATACGSPDENSSAANSVDPYVLLSGAPSQHSDGSLQGTATLLFNADISPTISQIFHLQGELPNANSQISVQIFTNSGTDIAGVNVTFLRSGNSIQGRISSGGAVYGPTASGFSLLAPDGLSVSVHLSPSTPRKLFLWAFAESSGPWLSQQSFFDSSLVSGVSGFNWQASGTKWQLTLTEAKVGRATRSLNLVQ